MRFRALLLAPFFVACATSAAAQRRAAQFQSAPILLTAPASRFAPDSANHRGHYTVEAAVFGGAVTGLLMALLTDGLCHDLDSNATGQNCTWKTIGGFVAGAVPGVVVGAIVGSLIPKAPATATK